MRPHDDAWRVRVTSRDVRAAAEAWWLARVSGASRERLVELWDDLLRLRRAQAAQEEEDEDARPDGGGPSVRRGDRTAGPPDGAGGTRGWTERPTRDGVVPHQR